MNILKKAACISILSIIPMHIMKGAAGSQPRLDFWHGDIARIGVDLMVTMKSLMQPLAKISPNDYAKLLDPWLGKIGDDKIMLMLESTTASKEALDKLHRLRNDVSIASTVDRQKVTNLLSNFYEGMKLLAQMLGANVPKIEIDPSEQQQMTLADYKEKIKNSDPRLSDVAEVTGGRLAEEIISGIISMKKLVNSLKNGTEESFNDAIVEIGQKKGQEYLKRGISLKEGDLKTLKRNIIKYPQIDIIEFIKEWDFFRKFIDNEIERPVSVATIMSENK